MLFRRHTRWAQEWSQHIPPRPGKDFRIKIFNSGPIKRGGRFPEDDVPNAFRGVRIFATEILKTFPCGALMAGGTTLGFPVPVSGLAVSGPSWGHGGRGAERRSYGCVGAGGRGQLGGAWAGPGPGTGAGRQKERLEKWPDQ